MPERTILKWQPVLQREKPRGELDVSWRWRVVVGRGRDCDVVLNHPSIPLKHGQFVRTTNVWSVGNFETSHGIYVRGKRITFEAVNQDEVDFDMLVRFRLETLAMGAEEASFREAIAAAPNDDGRYLVYADWLLEQDEPLGKLMVSPAPPGPAFLGPLVCDGITRTARHGFFDTVKVRSSKISSDKALVFAEVVVHPLSAFLLGLEVDAVLLNKETPTIAAENWVDWLFEALLHSPPATLRNLKIRLPARHALRFQSVFKALKGKLPHLQTTWETLFTEGELP